MRRVRWGSAIPPLSSGFTKRNCAAYVQPVGITAFPHPRSNDFCRAPRKRTPWPGARNFRRISGRNQLVGRIVEVRYSGLLAQVKLLIGGQRISSIITADAAREMRLEKGQTAAALIKSTEVMIVRV